MGRRPLFVPLPLLDVARSLRDPDDEGPPPSPGDRRITLDAACPCFGCGGEFHAEPLPDDRGERLRRITDAPEEVGRGDLTLIADAGGTRITCNQCDLDGFEEAVSGFIPVILEAAQVIQPGELLPTLAGVPFLPRGVDVLVSGSGTFALAGAVVAHVTQSGHQVLFVGEVESCPEGAVCVSADELLPLVLADPVGWRIASRDYDLVVVDVAEAPKPWAQFRRSLVRPCESAVLMLDGDGSRRHAAVKLATRLRRSSLTVSCEGLRLARAPFGVGDLWIGRDDGPLAFEAAQWRDERLDAVLEALLDAATSERAIARAAGLPKTTARRCLEQLAEYGKAVRAPNGWVVQPAAKVVARGPVDHPPRNGGAEPKTVVHGVVQKWSTTDRGMVHDESRGGPGRTTFGPPLDHPQTTAQSQERQGGPVVHANNVFSILDLIKAEARAGGRNGRRPA